jgi:hypothetical protein
VQNSTPFPNPFSVPFPYCLSESLARAYAHARERRADGAPTASDVFAAFARATEQADARADEHAEDGAGDDADPDDLTGQLDIAEIVGVMREPIAWVFTLAERRAQGDPVDLAAIQRVRDAALHRVDAIIAGSAPTDPPRIRAADVLTVATLLVGTLDPSLLHRAAQMLGGGIIDALAAVLPLAPMVNDVMSAQGPGAEPHARDSAASSWYSDYVQRAAAPFAGPYAAALGVPLAVPHLPRPLVPPWYWPHPGFPF